jgi:hypothetical protein
VNVTEYMGLFDEFQAPSWDGWRAILKRLTPDTKELWAIAGRGAGKSRVVALIASWFAIRDYRRAPGEFVYVGVFAPDRKQAKITLRYILGLLQSVPALASLIVSQTRDSVELSNGVIVEVITATMAAPRGRAYAVAIVEEAAFLPMDQSANPDVELLRAVRPALARVPGSLLCVVSSPYARRGVLHEAWKRHHDQPDGAVVFVQAPTLELNPTFDAAEVARAYEEDPVAAASEYGAQFRADIESFLSLEAIDAVIVPGRLELSPVSGVRYLGFLDPSGGGPDSFAAAVAHGETRDGRLVRVLDAVREVRPPFSPEGTVADLSAFLKSYRITHVKGDHYGGDWPPEQFRKHGITYVKTDRFKSDIYRDALAPINSGAVELLDVPRLRTQLAGLERRVARGGRDSIDHAPGSHDDVANAALGALLLVEAKPAVVSALPAGTTRRNPISRANRNLFDPLREFRQEATLIARFPRRKT